MWLGIWASVRKGEPDYLAFIERYNQFLEEDVVYICEHHHAEIHVLYDDVIREHKKHTGKPLYKYTWTEANDLMDKLEEACILWLSKETAGFSSDVLRKKRKLARASQKRKRRRRR